MNRILLAIATAVLLISCPLSKASEHPGFKGIYIGQSESDLPKSLKKSVIYYGGVHDGDYFSVSVMNGAVQAFSVIYIGETFDKTEIRKSVTVAQALKEHILSRSMKPSFALAKGDDGMVWGILDIEPQIAFQAISPTSPISPVSEVSYLRRSAPVLKTGLSNRLTEEQSSILLRAAQIAGPY